MEHAQLHILKVLGVRAVKEVGATADLAHLRLAEGLLDDHVNQVLRRRVLRVFERVVQRHRGLGCGADQNRVAFLVEFCLDSDVLSDRLQQVDRGARTNVDTETLIELVPFGPEDSVDEGGVPDIHADYLELVLVHGAVLPKPEPELVAPDQHRAGTFDRLGPGGESLLHVFTFFVIFLHIIITMVDDMLFL